MDEGPTTVGSIVGKLKIDDSDWNQRLDLAEAKAHELGAVDPTIKVEAKVDEAIAKLTAVGAAQEKLHLATDRLHLAYQRLDEIQASGVAKQSTLMAAHLAATQAENSHAKAARDLAAAEAALLVVEDQETAAVVRQNSANNQRMAHWQIIAILIAALVPLLASLSGYAVGVAGALGLMGVAGVFAILGIKNAMEDGLATGQRYSTGLRDLKTDLDGLTRTAALAMLDSFELAVGQINGAMPMLNGQVGTFSRLLGSAGNNLLAGVINSLRVLNPLFVQSANYVVALTQGFNAWTGNGGLQKFGDYAQRTLPQVADTLGKLATAALRLIEATAPIGTVMLAGITLVSNVISAFPIDVLTAIVTTVAGAAIGFKAWGLVGPIILDVATKIGILGVTSQVAMGPVGWITAGITALALIVAVAAGEMQKATAAQQDYTAAVQADTGAIRDNVTAQTAKALLDAGAYKAAQNLGIASDLVTRAALGQADAQAQLNDQLFWAGLAADSARLGFQKLTPEQQQTLADVKLLTGAVSDNSDAVQVGVENYKLMQGGMVGLSDATTTATGTQELLASRLGGTNDALIAAEDSQTKAADASAAATLQMQLENDAAGLLHNALTILNGGSLDMASAQTGLASANNSVLQSFIDNGTEINGNTKAAVSNQQAVQASVRAAQQLADATATQTGSSVAAAQSYRDSKQALEDQLFSQGLLTDETQAYIDKLYDVDGLVIKPTKLDVETAAASKKLADLLATLNGLDGRTIGFTVLANGTLTYNDAQNDKYDGHAAGGTVGGSGSGTSDSNLIWASRGEEVTRAAAAATPGVRPLLKAINANPVATMAVLAGGAGGKSVNHHEWNIMTTDPMAAAYGVLSLQNEMAAV